jgi:thioredoxin-dependent peroxiredoxin
VGGDFGRIVMAANDPVRVGDLAPDFTLTSTTGAAVRLRDFREKAEVVLFFYPKDNSPVCTAEACAFRDSYEDFRAAGAEVLGVSADSDESHRGFADRHGLPFPLLSDPGGALRARYGVPKTLGLFPGRVTYLIDKAGIVRHIFSSQFQPARHVAEALRVLASIRGEAVHAATIPEQ